MLITADRALLEGLIDYAGLFPPASLDMASAVAEYRAARLGPHAWMLGHFVCPASRLEELAGALMVSMRVGEDPWGVSIILDGAPGSAAVAARSFAAEMEPAASIAMLEVRLPAEACSLDDPAAAETEAAPFVSAAVSVSPKVMPFFEVLRTPEWRTGLPTALDAVARHRRRERRPLGAKLRCGGVDAAATPTIEQVVLFLITCRELDLPFKATAGLHHPVRRHDAQIGAFRHGFLNLLVAAALAEAGAGENTLRDVLDETDERAFGVSAAGVRWRDERVGARAVRRLRSERFASYGSCSFDEPVADLVALGLLGAGA